MKRINVAELLKDCPKGMELDCTIYDNVTLEYVIKPSSLPICVRRPNKGTMFLSRYGQVYEDNGCKCVIFPKGKATWEGFHRPFVDGDIVAIDSDGGSQVFIFEEYIREEQDYAHCYLMLDDNGAVSLERGDYYVERLATEEEKEKLFNVIKDHGFKWNAKTKTLEKLITPKFKVGDRIKHIVGREEIATVVGVEELHYNLNSKVGTSSFSISLQHEWELAPRQI